MKIGIITKIKKVEGYGFIRSADVPKDVFLHVKNCVLNTDFEKLEAGMQVVFDVKENEKGFVAMGVQIYE